MKKEKNLYDRNMAVVHMSEAEVVKDIAAVLAQVRQGVEIVVEQDHHAIAVIKSPVIKGRKISEIIAALEASGASAVIDADFARDVEEDPPEAIKQFGGARLRRSASDEVDGRVLWSLWRQSEDQPVSDETSRVRSLVAARISRFQFSRRMRLDSFFASHR